MRTSRIGAICRSHNPFTPSIALYQSFIHPSQHHALHSRSSSTSFVVQSSSHEPEINNLSSQAVDDKTHLSTFAIRKVFDALPSEPRPPHQRRPAERNLSFRRILPGGGPLEYRRKTSSDILASKQALAWNAWKHDYRPLALTPVMVEDEVGEWTLPWSTRAEKGGPTGMERLNHQIELFAAYARPTKFETYARDSLIKRIIDQVKIALPDHNIEVFGSSRTGLVLATSDIDFRISKTVGKDSTVSEAAPKALLRQLSSLGDVLRASGDYTTCEVRKARFPLIDLHAEDFGLDVQIVLGNDTSRAQSLIRDYLQEFPYLRDLYAVVKTMFEIRGLADTYRGGFGGYPIFMMLVASLRLNPPEPANAAGGLQSFMKFWSTFDTTKNGITIEPPLIFEKPQNLKYPGRPPPEYILHFPDPADSKNDLGRKGNSIKHLQKTMTILSSRLQSRTDSNTVYNLLKIVVGPVFDVHLAQRNKLHVRGQEVISNVKNALANGNKSSWESREAGVI